MSEKKVVTDFRISINYFLATGFIVGILILLLGGLVILFFGGIEKLQTLDSNPAVSILFSLIVFVILWIGIRYGADYVNKKFTISDNEKIAQFVVIYFAILFILPLLVNFDLMSLIRSVGLAIIYYYLSAKYLKKSI